MSSIIPCIVQPIESYGLYHTYGQELFCLLSRTCINTFSWEIQQAKESYRLVTLDHIESYKELLGQVDLHDSPEVFYEKLVTNKNLISPYGSHEKLCEIAQLRLWQWQHLYRGKIKRSRNKIEVQFKSRLNLDQEQKLKLFLEALYG